MFRYFYDTERGTDFNMYPTFGQAIDAAMMDFSSGLAKPVKVQGFNYADILDYHDLHWLYSRTWGCDYDRATGRAVPRRTTQDVGA